MRSFAYRSAPTRPAGGELQRSRTASRLQLGQIDLLALALPRRGGVVDLGLLDASLLHLRRHLDALHERGELVVEVLQLLRGRATTAAKSELWHRSRAADAPRGKRRIVAAKLGPRSGQRGP